MKGSLVAAIVFLALVAVIASGKIVPDAKWTGVDESVVEKFAKEAGRPPREPFINTDQGDLLLFLFLVAGAVGGFTAGYYYRSLFPHRPSAPSGAADV
jgi:ABC-type cobalt transport system substrate-binding protein